VGAAQIHPSAIIDAGAVLGPDVRVWHWVHVSAGAHVGAGSVLGQNVFVAPGVEIGAGCRIQNNVSVYAGVTLADEVFVGPSAVFTNVVNPRAHVSRKDEFAPTHVGRRATLGANCTVVCGVTIGAGALIGAGAVVTADVAPHVQVVGNPARASGWRCDCGAALPATSAEAPTEAAEVVSCPACGLGYVARTDGGLDLADGAAP